MHAAVRISIVFLFVGCGSSRTLDDAGPAPDSGGSLDSGGGSDWGECSAPSDCVVVERACCASCGSPPPLEAVDAVNAARVGDWRDEICPESPGCPPCAPAENPNLVATCEAGRCVAFDITRDHAECGVDTDCIIRVPDCCPCGADTSIGRLIALAASEVGDYVGRVCDPMQACLECEPVYPPEVSAVCVAGTCTAVAMMSAP